jgi:hypothetical protein
MKLALVFSMVLACASVAFAGQDSCGKVAKLAALSRAGDNCQAHRNVRSLPVDAKTRYQKVLLTCEHLGEAMFIVTTVQTENGCVATRVLRDR